MGDLVSVRTFSGPTARLDADLARNLLEAHDIESVVPGESSAAVMPGIDVLHLLVEEEDLERATEVLRGYLDEPSNPGMPVDE